MFAVIAILVLVPMAWVVFIATFDWNRARPWLQSRVGDAIGRSVEIGDLAASWHWRGGTQGADTWSPGFAVSARNVRIGNPQWAKAAQFAELAGIDIELRLLPLLSHRISIPSVHLMRPSLDIERRKDGSNNLPVAAAATGALPAWTLSLGEVHFDAGTLLLADAKRGLDLEADISALDAPMAFGQREEGDDPTTRREVIQRVGRDAAQHLREVAEERAARGNARSRTTPLPYVFAWKAHGTLRGTKVTGKGRFGGVLALNDTQRPFPLRADIDIGTTEIALTGTIIDPTSPDGIDMRLWISGPNLAELYPIAGLALPNTPPYATVGRLVGRFDPHHSLLHYEDFTARVGGSDLDGSLTYTSGVPHAMLTGDVESTLLQFKDLGALVGVGSQAGGDDASAQPSARVLPSAPFNVDRWHAMDANVHFTGKRVIRNKDLPISDVDTRVVMRNAVLTLDPLRFAMAGGTVTASLSIDANAKPPKGTLALDARKLQLRLLFEKIQGLSASLGDVNGNIKLSGNGHSIATLLGSSDGSLKLLMIDGQVSEKLMEEAGLNVANVLVAKLAGDRQIGIDCASADFTAKNGVLRANLFVFDTDNALIDIEGSIRLDDERVALILHPHTKGLRVLSLRSPLHVDGNFQKVAISVDKKTLLVHLGGAIGLGLVAAPLAALAPLIAPSGNEQKSCAPLLAQIKQSAHANAGEPGKTAAPAPTASRRGDTRKH